MAASSCSGGLAGDASPSPGNGDPLAIPGVVARPVTPLEKLNAECEKNTQDLAKGRAVYPLHLDMTVDDETTVPAAITLDPQRSPDQVLREATGSATALSVIAACFVQASLTAGDAFTISSLVSDAPQQVSDEHDARWLWSVTPKRIGDYTLTVSFRPVIPIDASGVPSSTGIGQVTPVTIEVTVSQPVAATIQAGANTATNWASLLTKLVGALTALIVAVLALRAAWRKRTTAGTDDDGGPHRVSADDGPA